MAETRRKPWRAGLLSLLLPGLGQVYNGQVKKGVLCYCLMQIVPLALLPVLIGFPVAPVNIAGPALIVLFLYLYVFVDAIRTARRLGDTYQRKAYNTWYLYLGAIVIIWYVVQPTVALPVRSLLIQAFKIPSGAMEKTLLIGDHILVDKLRYRWTSPQRFEVIVFRHPWEEERHFIERVIALPGERVQLQDRQVYVHAQLLQEPYTSYTARGRREEQFGPVVVPKRSDTIEIRSDQQLYVNGEPVPIPPGSYYPRDHGAAMTGFAAFYGPLFPEGTTLQKPMGPLVVRDDYYFVLGDTRDNSKDSRYWGFVPRANVLGVAKRVYWSWDRHTKWVRWERIGQEIR
jgi:signal peptidase I